MRWMVTMGSIGALAVGVVLGVTLATLAPGAEAAPKQQQHGRVIDLGTIAGVPDQTTVNVPLVDVRDCAHFLLMAEGNVAPPGGGGLTIQRTRTSPDGSAAIEYRVEASAQGIVGGVPTFSTSSSAPAAFVGFQLLNATQVTQDITASIWCSFH